LQPNLLSGTRHPITYWRRHGAWPTCAYNLLWLHTERLLWRYCLLAWGRVLLGVRPPRNAWKAVTMGHFSRLKEKRPLAGKRPGHTNLWTVPAALRRLNCART